VTPLDLRPPPPTHALPEHVVEPRAEALDGDGDAQPQLVVEHRLDVLALVGVRDRDARAAEHLGPPLAPWEPTAGPETIIQRPSETNASAVWTRLKPP
jgi:hypothetical protein